MIYDAVVLVGPDHKDLAIKTVRSLQVFSQARKIFIITNKKNFLLLGSIKSGRTQISLRDENELLEGLTLDSLKSYLVRRGALPGRAGWYLQQFLKMGICLQVDISDYYLIWDSDTIMLSPISFFDQEEDSKVLIKPSTEFHKPYFDVISRLLNMRRDVDFSFISEHMMVKKEYMRNLIIEIAKVNRNQNWVWNVLDLVDSSELNISGFSEFETYGIYIHSIYPESFKIRTLKSIRKGAKYLGMEPNRYDLYALSKKYEFVTFEKRHYRSFIKVKLWKTISYLIYAYDLMFRSSKKQFEAMDKICRTYGQDPSMNQV